MELELCGITKRYKSKLALDGVSLALTPGIYGLLGPNGAGKSTLMNIVADVILATEGTVRYNGAVIQTLGAAYRKKLGYLPQTTGYYKNFTAGRFLHYMAALKGLGGKESIEEAKRVLNLVNLPEQSGKKIGSFSGGMMQRLGIANALLGNPEILILDEPTAGLDPKERIRFRNIISELSENRIVILATHIVSDVEYIAKEIIMLKEGRIIRQGNAASCTQELNGMVWELSCPSGQLHEYEEKYQIINAAATENGLALRLIASERPGEGAREAEPNLEDVYLYFYGEDAAL